MPKTSAGFLNVRVYNSFLLPSNNPSMTPFPAIICAAASPQRAAHASTGGVEQASGDS